MLGVSQQEHSDHCVNGKILCSEMCVRDWSDTGSSANNKGLLTKKNLCICRIIHVSRYVSGLDLVVLLDVATLVLF